MATKGSSAGASDGFGRSLSAAGHRQHAAERFTVHEVLAALFITMWMFPMGIGLLLGEPSTSS